LRSSSFLKRLVVKQLFEKVCGEDK